MESVQSLLSYAVIQHGRDRTYTVRFGASTPIVAVYDDDTRLVEIWMVNEVIHEKKFY